MEWTRFVGVAARDQTLCIAEWRRVSANRRRWIDAGAPRSYRNRSRKVWHYSIADRGVTVNPISVKPK